VFIAFAAPVFDVAVVVVVDDAFAPPVFVAVVDALPPELPEDDPVAEELAVNAVQIISLFSHFWMMDYITY